MSRPTRDDALREFLGILAIGCGGALWTWKCAVALFGGEPGPWYWFVVAPLVAGLVGAGLGYLIMTARWLAGDERRALREEWDPATVFAAVAMVLAGCFMLLG